MELGGLGEPSGEEGGGVEQVQPNACGDQRVGRALMCLFLVKGVSSSSHVPKSYLNLST